MLRQILILTGIVLLALAANQVWRILKQRSIAASDQLELRATFDRWVEAGRPEAERLEGFMRGRRPDLTVTNRSFAIAGTNYYTQFAFTEPRSGWDGMLFVTTNRVLIWLDASDRATVVSPDRR